MENPVKLSVLYSYYNCPKMMAFQLNHWRSFSAEVLNQVEFVIIDDCSLNQPLKIDGSGLNLKTAIVETDIFWNVTGAKNLCAFVASSDWLLFSDMDRVFPENTIKESISVADYTNVNNYYKYRQVTVDGEHIRKMRPYGVFMINKAAFWNLGGFDEDFAPHYGFDDQQLLRRFKQYGMERKHLNEPMVVYDKAYGATPIEDGSQTCLKDTKINKVLFQEKLKVKPMVNPTSALRFQWRQGPSWTR